MQSARKKYIKFCFRDNRSDVVVPWEEGERILNSPNQLVKVMINGNWNGMVINKAEIIFTHRDYDEERYNNKELKLEAPKEEKVDISKFKPDFLKKYDELQKNKRVI